MLAIWKAVVLGIVEGLTEFLPVSSTGHLTITEKLMGLQIEGRGMTAFTAIIQVGAIIAAIIYFWRDFWRVIKGFIGGLFSARQRQELDWRLSLFVIVGSIPIAIVGLLAKNFIENQLRSLWVGGDRADRVVRGDGVRGAGGHPDARRERAARQRRPVHGRVSGLRADPRRVPVRDHDRRRPAARPGPGHRDPDVVPARRFRR